MSAMERAASGAPVDDASVQAYYALGEEADRLRSGIGRVEFLRTTEVIERTLPAAPATVADIGGGPGIYTDHLLATGYSVVHRDVVAAHVDHVRTNHPSGTATGDRLDAAIGDARRLDIDDDAADAVLLLGPLYHLAERTDRVAALREAARIARPAAPIYAATITRHAVLHDGIMLKRVDRAHPEVNDLLPGIAASGVLPPLFDGSFNAYTHRPDELRSEIADAGLALTRLVNIEGISFALHDIDERLDDAEERDRLMSVLRATESVEELLGVGPHLLAVAVASA